MNSRLCLIAYALIVQCGALSAFADDISEINPTAEILETLYDGPGDFSDVAENTAVNEVYFISPGTNMLYRLKNGAIETYARAPTNNLAGLTKQFFSGPWLADSAMGMIYNTWEYHGQLYMAQAFHSPVEDVAGLDSRCGFLSVADRRTGQVVMLDEFGKVLGRLDTSIGEVRGIAIHHGTCDIFLSSALDNYIYRFNLKGKLLDRFTIPGNVPHSVRGLVDRWDGLIVVDSILISPNLQPRTRVVRLRVD